MFVGTDQISSIENLTGGLGFDDLRGDDDTNVLAGDEGNDLLEGRGGRRHPPGRRRQRYDDRAEPGPTASSSRAATART